MHTDTTRENPQAVAPQAAESSQDLAATARPPTNRATQMKGPTCLDISNTRQPISTDAVI